MRTESPGPGQEASPRRTTAASQGVYRTPSLAEACRQGFLAGQRVEVLHLDAAGLTTSHTPMDLPHQRIRALVLDPTGDLYIAVDAGAIWRVTPRVP